MTICDRCKVAPGVYELDVQYKLPATLPPYLNKDLCNSCYELLRRFIKNS